MASRVGSFDDEMYYKLVSNDGSSIEVSDVDICNAIIDNTLKMEPSGEIYWLSQAKNIEQRIADSHDITKSNFGFYEK